MHDLDQHKTGWIPRLIALNDLSRHMQPMQEALQAAFARVLARGWFVLGPELQAFEQAFASQFSLNHAVGVANGTDAIELALRGAGICAGDEVILAPNAGMYAATALAAIGATPVYADVDDDLNLSPQTAAACITPRTRAIVVTHLFGRMADMPTLRQLADDNALVLMEDCAQALGAVQHGRHAGAWGDVSSFSFYPTKNLGALGDAGLVACRQASIAARVRQLRQYGWTSKYVVADGPARNSRLDELQAAFLSVQLPMLADWNARRRAVAARYASARHPLIRHPRTEGEDYVAHLYVVRTSKRDALMAHLRDCGISSDIHYPLIDSDQPFVHDDETSASVPVAAAASREILTLPCYPELTDHEIEQVCKALLTWNGE